MRFSPGTFSSAAHAAPAGSRHDANNIDILRALAVLAVVAHHYAVYSGVSVPLLGPQGGGMGVQLFFLISGYLIVQSAGKHSVGEYVLARFFRIFPVYWLALCSFMVVDVLLAPPMGSILMAHRAAFVLNLLNLQQLSVVSTMFLDRTHVGWTLTVELFWYTIVLMLCLVQRWLRWRHFWLLMLALTVAIGAKWVIESDRGTFNHWFTSQAGANSVAFEGTVRHALVNSSIAGYLYFFVLGATMYRYEATLRRIPAYLLWPVAALVLCFWERTPGWTDLAPNPITAVGLGCLFLLILRARPIQEPVLRYIGKVSYSIYLVHAKVMVLAYLQFKLSGPWVTIAVFALIGVLATAMFYGVERPMIRLGQRLRQRMAPPPGAPQPNAAQSAQSV